MRFLLNSLSRVKENNNRFRAIVHIYIYVVFGNILMCLMQVLKIVYSKHCMHLIHDTHLD